MSEESTSRKSHQQTISESLTNYESYPLTYETLNELATSSVLVLIPVTITLVLVVISIHILCVQNTCIHVPIDELFPIFSKTDTHDIHMNATNALKNTGLLLTYIVLATFFLLGLIYFRLYKVLLVFGIILIIMLCTMKTLIYWHNLLFVMDIPIDNFTVGILTWNLSITGLIIFFILKSPLLIQQIYLIYISLLVSNFIITLLTISTAWALLVFLIIWDLIAVLTPCGPLNLMLKLIRNRQKQKEEVYLPPVLIYSTMIWNYYLVINQQNDSRFVTKHRPNLGLGDFIFYSLLMGQTRQVYSLLTVWFAGLSILAGLIATLLCLAWLRRPLPALPISLTIAIGSVLTFHFCCEPFAQYLNSNLIFI